MAVLSLALIGAGTALTLSLLRLDEAMGVIDEQSDIIDEQRKIIETKEEFAAAMQGLVATTTQFEGVLFGSIVPTGRYDAIANRAWTDRWDADALERHTADAIAANEELSAVLADAREQAGGNGTGSTFEAVIDQLGGGYVRTIIDDADTLCESDVLGCVISNDPYLVHFDAADDGAEYMTDWVRTGVAYHEFAHVLQMTNPEPTAAALAAFGGDEETMADCFALTILDGWTLDHRIWVSGSAYWDLSVGYGHVCDDAQRQAVRDWYGQLGYRGGGISQ